MVKCLLDLKPTQMLFSFPFFLFSPSLQLRDTMKGPEILGIVFAGICAICAPPGL